MIFNNDNEILYIEIVFKKKYNYIFYLYINYIINKNKKKVYINI